MGARKPQDGDLPRTPTCLVIEDDPSTNHLLAEALRRVGFEPIQAFDGATGLDLARTLRPSLVTLDLDLPGLPGSAVLKAMRADPLTASIPVLIISGVVSETGLADMQGAAAIVRKPFDLAYVSRLIRRLARGE